MLLKAVFHSAKFFDRIEIFFCLTSTQPRELNRNILKLNNRNFGSIEKFRRVENRLNFPTKGLRSKRRRFSGIFQVVV